MAKDTQRNRYLSVAVPRTSRLLQRIEEVSQETNLPDSQILVYFASEYVRLLDGNGSLLYRGEPARAEPAAATGTSFASAKTMPQASGASDEELESYGEPD